MSPVMILALAGAVAIGFKYVADQKIKAKKEVVGGAIDDGIGAITSLFSTSDDVGENQDETMERDTERLDDDGNPDSVGGFDLSGFEL
jgi:hypothetical protein